ncbi:MAG TPA: alpha/beta fold hydrolase, partial [Kofleriaceae bacterium]
MSVITPERLVVRQGERELVGYALGQPLGSAPVVAIVGGITASPFPFAERDAWWPAIEPLVDPAHHTILTLAWPGNGSSEIAGPLGAFELADLFAAWLDGIGCTQPLTYLGASLGGLVGIALASRHPA